jgi:hypothetical protein
MHSQFDSMREKFSDLTRDKIYDYRYDSLYFYKVYVDNRVEICALMAALWLDFIGYVGLGMICGQGNGKGCYLFCLLSDVLKFTWN